MKILKLKTQWIAYGMAAIASASPAMADEVDFVRLNPILQALLNATIAGDALIDVATPRFDEGFSSVQAERLKYDVTGTMKNVPWESGTDTSAAVIGTSTYVVPF